MVDKNICFSVDDLPPSPVGKIGWPWVISDQSMLTHQQCSLPNLKISIVTPSYNQGAYIEATIRSVLLQGYPNLEYMVIDGGSTDDTVEILRKYDQYLTYWVSEADRGQSHALNKGLEKVTGDIFTFINSDDMLAANALHKVANAFQSHPSIWALYGGHSEIDQGGNFIQSFKPHLTLSWQDLALGKTYQPQPGTFWRTSVFDKIGPFREDLHYFFDQEFFIRLLMHYRIEPMEDSLAYARIHGNAKTQSSSLTWIQEIFTERLKLLPLAERNFFRQFLAYRLLRINFLRSTTLDGTSRFSERLKILLSNPILLTSSQGLRMLLKTD